VEKALKAKQEFEASGYEFSAGMLAVLFDLMVRVGNLNEAERSLRELNQLAPNFILDEHKIIDFAALLVSKNHVEGRSVMFIAWVVVDVQVKSVVM
jgi:leucine-rich PPR motif-containing protein